MTLRNTIEFKKDEFNYAVRAQKTLKFILSNASKKSRAAFYEEFVNRGRDAAMIHGIAIPPGYPTSSLSEVFFDRIYDIEGFIPGPSDIVVDVGANSGDWTIYCSKVLGAKEVYAFEPLYENISWARAILNLNGCNNTHLFDVALSDVETEKDMGYNGNMLAKSLGVKASDRQIVRFRTLDSYSLPCTILKIDVEGFELNVLNGAIQTIRNNKPRIVIETHSLELRKKCDALLRSEGYKLRVSGRSINAKKRWPSSQFDIVTNLFYSYEK